MSVVVFIMPSDLFHDTKKVREEFGDIEQDRAPYPADVHDDNVFDAIDFDVQENAHDDFDREGGVDWCCGVMDRTQGALEVFLAFLDPVECPEVSFRRL